MPPFEPRGTTFGAVEPLEEHNQTWRVLEARLDSRIDTHYAEQWFYFDDRRMLVRNDYLTGVAKGNATHGAGASAGTPNASLP